MAAKAKARRIFWMEGIARGDGIIIEVLEAEMAIIICFELERMY